MLTEDVISLVKAYARRGIEDWKSVKAETHAKTLRLLGNHRLAQNTQESDNAIPRAIRGQNARMLFFPMPNKNQGKHIEQCLFSLRRVDDNRTSFDLLLLCHNGSWLGFRFEPPDEIGSHGFSHVQMCRKIKSHDASEEVEGLVDWVPDHYPAFPLRASDPLQMFLSLVTSIHGYPGGVDEVLRDLMPRPEIKQFFDSLQEIA
jgi:hypothetical protein